VLPLMTSLPVVPVATPMDTHASSTRAVRPSSGITCSRAMRGPSGGTLRASHWNLVHNARCAVIVDLGIEIETGPTTIDNSIVASHQAGFCASGAVPHHALFHGVGNACIAGAS